MKTTLSILALLCPLTLALACGPDVEDIDTLAVTDLEATYISERARHTICIGHTHAQYNVQDDSTPWRLTSVSLDIEGRTPAEFAIGMCAAYEVTALAMACAEKNYGPLSYTFGTQVEHRDDSDAQLDSEVQGVIDLCEPYKPVE